MNDTGAPMNQKSHILSYMRAKGRITSLLARTEFGVERLAARIGELEAAGHNIHRRRKRAVNGKRYTEYSLQHG